MYLLIKHFYVTKSLIFPPKIIYLGIFNHIIILIIFYYSNPNQNFVSLHDRFQSITHIA